jgi:hypothetical protein
LQKVGVVARRGLPGTECLAQVLPAAMFSAARPSALDIREPNDPATL